MGEDGHPGAPCSLGGGGEDTPRTLGQPDAFGGDLDDACPVLRALDDRSRVVEPVDSLGDVGREQVGEDADIGLHRPPMVHVILGGVEPRHRDDCDARATADLGESVGVPATCRRHRIDHASRSGCCARGELGDGFIDRGEVDVGEVRGDEGVVEDEVLMDVGGTEGTGGHITKHGPHTHDACSIARIAPFATSPSATVPNGTSRTCPSIRAANPATVPTA